MPERDDRVAVLIKRVHNAFKRRLDQNAARPPLTQAQCDVLLFLHKAEQEERRVCPSDLEGALHLSRPTVTGLIQRLKAKGFIAVLPDPEDKRFKRLTVTEKANRHHLEMTAYLAAQEQQMLQGFGPEELRQLKAYLKRLLVNLEEDAGDHD